MSQKAKISVIICSRDRATSLKQCLNSLSQDEMTRCHAELILVDSNSKDDTLNVMEQFLHRVNFQVKIVHLDQVGLGKARNAGIRYATADILAFTDDDCHLLPGYIDIAVQKFDPCMFQYCRGTIIHNNFEKITSSSAIQSPIQLIPAYSVIIPGITIEGASMLIHRKIFETIGGFHPDLGAGTEFRCEDIEFIAKASAHGFTGAYIPQLVVHHHHGREGRILTKLNDANAVARGAFYLMVIFRGYRGYLHYWAKTAIPRRISTINFAYARRLFYELYGAFLFLLKHRRQIPEKRFDLFTSL